MADGTFDPRQHLSQVNGNPYLEVKWRLVWLRDQHPDAELTTEMVKRGPDYAVFCAVITLPTGGKATGHGSETAGDYPDFIEKAETKAIGRALNALGYGIVAPVAAAGNVAGANRQPVADAAARRERATQDLAARQDPPADEQRPVAVPLGPNVAPSGRQLGYLRVVAREIGLEPDEAAQRRFGVPVAELSRRQASELIDWLQDAPDGPG